MTVKSTPPALPDEAGEMAALILVKAQARDQGLWFDADTLPEAYLQGALRKLDTYVPNETISEGPSKIGK